MAKTPSPTSRRAARETALRTLYTLEVGRALYDSVVEESIAANNLDEDAAGFARSLIQAATANRAFLDQTIGRYAIGYPPAKQTVVDRNILRLALAELTSSLSDATPAIVISEAVELAKKYSTPEAARFVNGVLGAATRPQAPETPSETEESPVA